MILRIEWSQGYDTHIVLQGVYVKYLPIPLVLLTDMRGAQYGGSLFRANGYITFAHVSHGHSVAISPAASEVASAEFPDQIEFWQNSLPGKLKGKLESVSHLYTSRAYLQALTSYTQLNGARAILINGLDPFVSVNANAAITGAYQSFWNCSLITSDMLSTASSPATNSL